MREGYIKLYRQSLDHGWLKNHELWAFWCYCLLRANHEKNIVKIGFQEISLNPGQFIFGRVQTANDLNMTEWKIRSCLAFLKKYGNITIKTTNKFSIITVINWAAYQGKAGEKPPADSPTTRQQPAREKNDKEDISADLYDFYLEEIKPKQKSKQRAVSNILNHLKNHSPEELRAAIQNYKKITISREPQYRKDPANFFQIREPAFKDYLHGDYQSDEPNNPQTPEWF